jgi:hypothetical protein
VPTVVYGLREISAAYAKLERDTRAGMRKTLSDAAEPVQRSAEQLAQARISRIGNRWWKMRVGVTRTLVYVAPREKGIRGRKDDPRHRGSDTGPPSFPGRLMDDAMEPALERNEAKVEQLIGRFLDHVVDDFNH